MELTLDLEQIKPKKNPDLILERHLLGCYFGEKNSERRSGMLYEGVFLYEPDSNEIITATAEVY